jgi:hypothetical protein
MGLRSFHSCGGYGKKKQKTRSTRNQKPENIPAELEKKQGGRKQDLQETRSQKTFGAEHIKQITRTTRNQISEHTWGTCRSDI